MLPKKRAMLWINLLGGVGVLGSYVIGLSSHPGSAGLLWGGVPSELRPLYTAGMLLAALGYFAFTYFLLLRVDPVDVRLGKRFGFELLNWLYLGILVPSALWMPLTWMMIERPANGLWCGIRAILIVVGLASMSMVIALLRVRPRNPEWAHRLALIGGALFTAHTALLDALVWPAFFRG
jgi:hypothetical protein